MPMANVGLQLEKKIIDRDPRERKRFSNQLENKDSFVGITGI